MNPVKFNDWSDLGVKKDIEQINKKIGTHESILATIGVEVFISAAVIILDHLFDANSAPRFAWIAAAVFALVPPVFVFGRLLYRWIKKIIRVKHGKYDINGFVDTFDNSICYWALMCQSFVQLLNENGKGMSPEEKLFYYQEVHFYINKSYKKLHEMMPIAEKVFTDRPDELKHKRMVSLQRLNIILNLLQRVRYEADEAISKLGDYKCITDAQKSLSSDYHKMLDRFLRKLGNRYPDYSFEKSVDLPCK